MSDSTELSMADDNAIARAMQTLTFKEWSVLADNSELIYRGLQHLKKGEDNAVAEKKLIAQICRATENSRKQALQKKQSQENKKIKL